MSSAITSYRHPECDRLNLTFGGLDFSVLPAFLLLSFATNAVASLGAEVRQSGRALDLHFMLLRRAITIGRDFFWAMTGHGSEVI